MTAADIAALCAHAERDYPNECCGVLLGDLVGDVRHIRELRPATNVHNGDTERRYLVSPELMLELMRQERTTGRLILGFYHSHPDCAAIPSECDREWAFPFYTYIIVSVQQGEAQAPLAWLLSDDRERFLAETIEVK